MARYDILSAAPHHTLALDAATACADPFALLRAELGERAEPVADVPFARRVRWAIGAMIWRAA